MLELLVLILLAGLAIMAVLFASLSARVRAQEAMVRDLVLRLDAGGSPLTRKAAAPAAETGAQTLATPPFSPTTPPSAPTGSAASPLNPLEALVGGRLFIWIGGVALVVAAVFLIRFSIDMGWVTPAMRMAAAGLFGAALVAGGEWARAAPRLADDQRLSQALVGAGLAILYATVYGAYWLYGFVGPTAATVLMVAVTLAALGLSMRHGAPTAVMGLVGGFLTPLLVGDPGAGAVPLLAYLALLDAAVFALALRRGWMWLAGLAIAASLAWTGVLLFDSAADAIAGAWFALILAILAGLAGRKDNHIGTGWPMAVAAAEAAGLAGRSDVGDIGWLVYALAGAAALVLARLRPAGRWVPLVALALGLLLIPVKAAFDSAGTPPVAALAMTLIFGGGGLALALERRRESLLLTACLGLAGPVLMMRLLEADHLTPPGWGLLIAALGLVPLALVRRRSDLAGSLLGAATATIMLTLALGDLVAWDYLSIGWLVLALALIGAGVGLGARALRIAGLALLTLTVLKVFLIDAAALEGLLRILSFVGLGAALIVIGLYFGRLVRAEARTSDA